MSIDAYIVKAQRHATARCINENPLGVVITRRTFVQHADGGRAEQTSVLPAFTGRLVPRKRVPRFVQDEAGLRQTSELLLLAPHTADVRAGTEVLDSFTANGKQYRITEVVPRSYRGQVYSVHVHVEEMK